MAYDRYARNSRTESKADKVTFIGVDPSTFPANVAKDYDAMIEARDAYWSFKKKFEASFCTAKKLDANTTKFGYKSGVAFAPNVPPTRGKAVSFDEA